MSVIADDFGGVLVEDEPQGTDEFGGIAVDSEAESPPAPTTTPSLRASFDLPGSPVLPSRQSLPPLQAEYQRLEEARKASEVSARQREAFFLTPDQIRRLDEGSIAENLMTAPPGIEAPMVTPQRILERFPSMSDNNAKILAGVLQAGAGMWNFAASPVGVASLPVAGMAGAPGLAGAAGKAALGTFAIDAARAIPEKTAELGTALGEGDIEKSARLATELVMLGAVEFGSTKGLAKSVSGIPSQEAGAISAKAKAAGMDATAAALDQLAKQVETAPIEKPSPLHTATAEARPSADLLSTPEALRRANELQVTETPGPVAPEGMVRTEARFENFLPREIKLQVDETVIQAAEAYRLAKQRQAERLQREQGGKLDTSGETFASIADTPGFLQSAEQRISQRPLSPEPITDVPEITASTPLKTVEQIVRERLERRDFVNAVAALGQTKAEVSRKLVDKLIGVGKESVPLSAGEKTIFNAIWDSAVERLTKPPELRAEVAKIVEEAHSSAGEPGKLPQDQAVKAATVGRPELTPSTPAAEATAQVVQKIQERITGLERERNQLASKLAHWGEGTETHRSLLAQVRHAEGLIDGLSDAVRQVTHANPTLVQRLEALKTPLDPGVGANPFPQIAKAVWNTSIDVAIGVIKAGGHIKAAIEAALSHLRKNAQGFDESAVRTHLEKILRAESQAAAGAKAATEVADRPRITTPENLPQGGATPAGHRPLGELYSEPLVERLGRLGGPVARKVTQENLGIIDTAKRLYGELSASVLDNAKQAVGKAFRGGTTWVHGLREVTRNAGVSRFHEMLDVRANAGNWDHVPSEHRALAGTLFDANLAIGKLAEKANPSFRATGKAQRMLTAYGFDIVRRGRGAAWEAWAEGLAKANGMPIERSKAFLQRWKKELDATGIDAAHLDRIAQDFERFFPVAVTHIRPRVGFGWHEIIHSSPFSYLEAAAQRTANAVAFRQVYPLIEHNGKWVSSGKLEATRNAVQRELTTDRHATEFDNVMRALQGHPLDTFTAWWNAPDTMIGAGFRMVDASFRPIRALMLSASLPVNIGEALSGGAHIFLGYGRAFQAAIKERRLYDDLKRSGMLNAAIRDFSFDPTQPGRSLSRQTSNLISRTFLSDLMNEFQEYTGAAAARIIANEIRSGTLPKGDVQRVIATMRAMGIDRQSAIAAVDGRNPKAVQEFETKAAEFLSAGNKALAEQSRLGASRAFNSLFWFHSYPMSKVRQLRSLVNNFIEDFERRDWQQATTNAFLVGRFLGGTTLAGAITTGIMRLLYDGVFGSEIQIQEAQDDFAGFIQDSIIMGMGGPLQIAARILDQGGDMSGIVSILLWAMAPVGIAQELSDAALGRGKYEGTDEFERVGLFLQSKTPASKAIRQGMAAFGLSQDNAELDAAIKAFYRWRRDKYGHVQRKSFLEDEHDRKRFRHHMKRAVEALKDGKLEEYEAEIEKAMADPSMQSKPRKEVDRSISSSLRARTILKTPSGAPLDDAALNELRQRIGDKAVEKLEMFDELLRSEARN